MPIVDVEIVAAPEDKLAADLAQSLADAAGRALDSPPGRTWVRLRVLAHEHYAENGLLRESTELPVFVTVLKRTLPEAAVLAREMARLAGSIAEATGRDPALVHIEYAPAAVGRLSFGGKLVQ
jgi:phenylpyruvate tautomerase PptA (4-oxalocrotonate tautomerase family)